MSETPSNPVVRCAIYTRSATNDKTSLIAQEQECRAAAATKMDEKYIVSAHRTKVWRGKLGRLYQGYTPGGRCYGYASYPDLVPNTTNGKSRRLGSKLRIVPSEAETICTIYRLFADGVSVGEIVRGLNDNSVPGPKKPATGNVPNLWNPRLVRGLLKRECYRGTVEWGRTERVRDQEAGRIEMRKKPDGEIIRVPAPELRIVDDELAAKVDARLNSKDEPGETTP